MDSSEVVQVTLPSASQGVTVAVSVSVLLTSISREVASRDT